MKALCLRWPCLVCALAAFTILFPGCSGDEDDDKSPTVQDIDGNVYTKVPIGSQVWLKENLTVTRFADGEEMGNLTNSNAWRNTGGPAFCYYDNTPANGLVYGKLYNFTAAYYNPCPNGWHVPTIEEWNTLIGFLGGELVAGGKLKSAGTMLWEDPNTDAADAVGFSAHPGGIRYAVDAAFNGMGEEGQWWSSTLDVPTGTGAAIRLIYDDATVVRVDNALNTGASIRCIKD
jgi:uncharacterized protein (TIGR02145 family)